MEPYELRNLIAKMRRDLNRLEPLSYLLKRSLNPVEFYSIRMAANNIENLTGEVSEETQPKP